MFEEGSLEPFTIQKLEMVVEESAEDGMSWESNEENRQAAHKRII